MIRALFLIFDTGRTWDGIASAHRSIRCILGLYLLPMMLIVALAEGCSLVRFGNWQPVAHQIRHFSVNEAVVFEIIQLLLMLAVVGVCTYLVKAMGETFHSKHNYRQAFTVVCYGLSPLFLLRLLDVFPKLSPWISFGIGMIFVVRTVYYGLPRVMEPDPPHAFGFYLTTCLIFTMVAGLERFVTAWYLGGNSPGMDRFIAHLVGQLPF